MHPSEADKMVDDLQAVRADVASGDPTLMAHAFGTMASIMSDVAKRCEGVPGLSRMRKLLLEQADDALTHKAEIEQAQASLRQWADAWKRDESAQAKRKESREDTIARTGQADLFGGSTRPSTANEE